MTEALTNRIAKELEAHKSLVVAIDGNCCAGKTTLAAALEGRFGARVFHADDYFLRPEQRTPERMAETGGNFDRERFFEEVAKPALERRDALCKKYFCKTGMLSDAFLTPFAPLTVVEGSYCLHPELGKYFDISVFLRIGAQKQGERILARNGKAAYDTFMQRWVPMENAYFAKFDIAARCDFVLDDIRLIYGDSAS